MDQEFASSATKRNWKRLKTETYGRLTSRANKRLSVKRILPLEYFSDPANVPLVQELVRTIQKKGWTFPAVSLSIGVNLLKKAGIFEKTHVQESLRTWAESVRELKFAVGVETEAKTETEMEYGSETKPEAEEKTNREINLKTDRKTKQKNGGDSKSEIEIWLDSLRIPELEERELPVGERDLPGLICQCLFCEGEKNRAGSYYTPLETVRNMTQSFDFSRGQTFFDPCCGSGSFFLELEGAEPEQMFGLDRDPAAVLNARINLLLKFREKEFPPQIFCSNFLKEEYFTERFDYAATNPPWGAVSEKLAGIPEITSGETFSYFLVKTFQMLKEGGTLRFLVPESILNVRTHRDIRQFLLTRGRLRSVTRYAGKFSGVMTPYADIEFQALPPGRNLQVHLPKKSFQMQTAAFEEAENCVLSLLEKEEREILRKVKHRGKFTLRESVWALGIVTGGNRKKLLPEPGKDTEPIFTGKEVQPYALKPPKHFVVYDRTQFQQAAKDEFYRLPEKLAYKFISKRLTFSYDDSRSLFLNSANLLCPKIPGMSVKTALISPNIFR